MAFKSFNPPCDPLDLSWYANFQHPQYRTVDVVGIRILKTEDILFKNVNGQIINLARDVGTDKENVRGLKDSFTSQGWDTSKVPPIIEESDSSLLDGFSRHEALLDLDQQYGFYLVVRRKSEFSIDDVIDEIGLGANNHSQSKKANMGDFKKRFHAWVIRNKDVTLNEGRQWFASIPNSFSDVNIDKAIEDVFDKQKASENMEGFSKTKAEEKAAKLLNLSKDEVIAINKGATKKGGYMKKAITDVIYYYEKHGKVPEVVGFLNKIPAENSRKKRKELETEIDLINNAMTGLLSEYKKNPSFKLINFKGHVPQVIGKETKLVRY
ncbi:hypothetical protein [uncultured Mediterranean phage]|nr:hypothetical protein [uncultured Mediterranean phage]